MSVLLVAAQATLLALAVFVGVAISHKAVVVARGDAETLLIRSSPWAPTGWAAQIILFAIAAEALTEGLLFVLPSIGLLFASALFAVYGFALHGLNPEESCGCFGAIMPMTNRAAVQRNVVFTMCAAVSAGVAFSHNLTSNLLTQTTLGIALIAVALVAGSSHAARLAGGWTAESSID